MVVGLKSPEQRAELDRKNRAEQEELRQAYEKKNAEKPLLTLEQARARRTPAPIRCWWNWRIKRWAETGA